VNRLASCHTLLAVLGGLHGENDVWIAPSIPLTVAKVSFVLGWSVDESN